MSFCVWPISFSTCSSSVSWRPPGHGRATQATTPNPAPPSPSGSIQQLRNAGYLRVIVGTMGVMIADALTVPTPDGPFSILASTDAVLASGWTDDYLQLAGLIHRTIRPKELNAFDSTAKFDASSIMATARAAVTAYYDGDHHAPGAVRVNQVASPFRSRVWEELRSVHPGERLSYLDLARRAGKAEAARAAGSSCAYNAAALFVPCHRIVRSDGGLGGFRYGIPLKERLLTREGEDPYGSSPETKNGVDQR